MLHREDREGLVVISQPAHAWISGQLARAWGNELFAGFSPAEEVALAGEQHDIGFLEWEQSPTLNPDTGLPHTFFELPTASHLEIWSRGIRHMLQFGRYPALLVSLHYTGLAQQHPIFNRPTEAQMTQNFLDDQCVFQSTVLRSLRHDSYFAAFSSDEIIARNRRLVSAWDWMSLLLCMGLADSRPVENVPHAKGITALHLSPLAGTPNGVSVSPWPFRDQSVPLVVEGHRLPDTYKNEKKMREALKKSPPVTIQMNLRPG